jgi:hypothetical protein
MSARSILALAVVIAGLTACGEQSVTGLSAGPLAKNVVPDGKPGGTVTCSLAKHITIYTFDGPVGGSPRYLTMSGKAPNYTWTDKTGENGTATISGLTFDMSGSNVSGYTFSILGASSDPATGTITGTFVDSNSYSVAAASAAGDAVCR